VQDPPRDDDELPDLGEAAIQAQPERVIPDGSEQEWHEHPVGEFKRYRTLVNLNGIGAGVWIEIDPEDPAWWGAIEAKFIVSEADWQGPIE
jgi:hypothetical protein